LGYRGRPTLAAADARNRCDYLLGNTLKDIYQAKLAWQFPHAPCIVELYAPESDDDFIDYQLSFWQLKHERVQA
jgi:hypothetical protein